MYVQWVIRSEASYRVVINSRGRTFNDQRTDLRVEPSGSKWRITYLIYQSVFETR